MNLMDVKFPEGFVSHNLFSAARAVLLQPDGTCIVIERGMLRHRDDYPNGMPAAGYDGYNVLVFATFRDAGAYCDPVHKSKDPLCAWRSIDALSCQCILNELGAEDGHP